MGKKPLYYWQHGDALYFASELKALLAVPGLRARLNLEALHHYLSYKHVPHPLTIFEGVADAAAGASAGVPAGHASREISRYWVCRSSPRDGRVPDEQRSRRRTARPAARRRSSGGCMSDVPDRFLPERRHRLVPDDGAGRRGGAGPGQDVHADLRGQVDDRRQGTAIGVGALGGGAVRHRASRGDDRVRPLSRTASGRSCGAFDEPFAGVVSTYFLSQRMAQHVKVAVAGDGADELFGSYLSHRIAAGIEPSPVTWPRRPDWDVASRVCWC